MTEVITLQAQKREKAGKGAARADRKNGLLPIVIYGNKQPALSLTVSFNEVLKLLNHGGFKTADFTIEVDGKSHKVKFQTMQEHPVQTRPIHIDFVRVA